MNYYRITLLALISVACSGILAAETIAVTVRDIDPEAASERALSFVEQGMMDQMFDSGHIVFNIATDALDQTYFQRVLDEAFEGGARFAVLLGVSMVTRPGRGPLPDAVRVTFVRVATGDVLLESVVLASEIVRSDEMASDLLSERLGERAALLVLEVITGGNQAW